MELSQDRTRSVLEHCLGLPDLIADDGLRGWTRQHLTANGLSSSHLILKKNGDEDKKRSRRVEFRTKTAAEKKVVEIIEQMKGQ